MRYGGGGLMQMMLFWDRSLENVSMRDVVRLENKEAAECRWQARLLYPQRIDESQRIIDERDLDGVEAGPDPESHLNSRLVLPERPGPIRNGAGGRARRKPEEWTGGRVGS